MSFYLKNGSKYSIAESRVVETQLPADTYAVKQDMNGNFYLEVVDDFVTVPKLYGDVQKRADKILHTYMDRSVSTGVLLSGEKGSGKSLLAKHLCLEARNKYGLATIIVSSPFHGDTFNKFIQNIEQRCIILFDEFEKIYDKNERCQQGLLTLLDGVYTTTKLFLFTVNDKYALDRNMHNRPGRIFYNMDYKRLNDEFIQDYCNDCLKNKDWVGRILCVAQMFGSFNFDMLKALVEEVNRYDEDPVSCINDLNIKPEFSSNQNYDVSAWDKEGNQLVVVNSKQSLNILAAFNFYVDYTFKNKTDEGEEFVDSECQYFGNKDLVKIDPKTKEVTLVNSDGFRVQLKKSVEVVYNWQDAF